MKSHILLSLLELIVRVKLYYQNYNIKYGRMKKEGLDIGLVL